MPVDFDINASSADVKSRIEEILKEHGPVDVIVNNAGYGQFGSLEEVGADLLEKQFVTNVFGPIKVATAFLPHLRSKKSGLIINIGSRSGYDTVPCVGPYDSSKAALQNLSVTLDNEVSGLGIRSVLIEPGVFRTTFLTSANKNTDPSVFPAHIPDYEDARQAAKQFTSVYDQKQTGDPQLLSNHLVDLAHKRGSFEKEVPAIVTFGADSIDSIKNYAQGNLDRMEKWKDVIVSTDRHDW